MRSAVMLVMLVMLIMHSCNVTSEYESPVQVLVKGRLQQERPLAFGPK